jgi:serine/threonine-protein kinase PknG
VSHIDPGFVSAVFALARCYLAKGDRKAAVAALDRIPQSSALYVRSRIEAARLLIRNDHTAPGVDELVAASSVVESLSLDGIGKHKLVSQVLGAALDLVESRVIQETQSVKVLGRTLEEVRLRSGLEDSFRSMARLVKGEERIRLIDRANQVRPRTLV